MNIEQILRDLDEHMKSNDQLGCIHNINQLVNCEGLNADALICKFYGYPDNLVVSKYYDHHYVTFLMKASYYGLISVVKYLIEVLHADPNITDYSKWTALYYAIKNEQHEIAEYLVNLTCINSNMQNIKGWTALHLSVYRNDKKGTELLLKSGKVDISICDNRGFRAKQFAIILKHRDIADLIKNYKHNNCIELTKPAHTYQEHLE